MRLFVAVELPPVVQARVAAQQQALRLQFAAAGSEARVWRWTPPANVHLTLRFLGATAEAQQRLIEDALAAAAAAVGPFTLDLGALGAFPNLRRPRILWLALSGDLPALAALQVRVEHAAGAAGFPPEPRPFTPHLTLARTRPTAAPTPLTATLPATAGPPPGEPFAVPAIHLVASDLRPAGPLYHTLASFTLAGDGSAKK